MLHATNHCQLKVGALSEGVSAETIETSLYPPLCILWFLTYGSIVLDTNGDITEHRIFIYAQKISNKIVEISLWLKTVYPYPCHDVSVVLKLALISANGSQSGYSN